MSKNKTFDSPYGKMTLKVFDYNYNSRLAILLYESNGDEYGDLTVNLSDFFLSDIDEGFINSNMDTTNGRKIVDNLKKLGVIKESYGFRKYNYGTYEYVKFDLDKLKEYDPMGVENYLNKVEEMGTLEILSPSI